MGDLRWQSGCLHTIETAHMLRHKFEPSAIPHQAAPFSIWTIAKRALVVVALAMMPGALAVFLYYRWYGLRNRQSFASDLPSKFAPDN
jgi:hypothetical protein